MMTMMMEIIIAMKMVEMTMMEMMETMEMVEMMMMEMMETMMMVITSSFPTLLLPDDRRRG